MRANNVHVAQNGRVWQVALGRRARKNLIVRVRSKDCLSVQAPPRVPWRDIEQFLASQAQVIESLAQAFNEPVLWRRGQAYTPDNFPFRQPGQSVRDALMSEAQTTIPALYAKAAARMNKTIPMTLSSAKSYWGVYRPGRIRLNWRLIGAPDWVIDYVCVHELAHSEHLNHGPEFWRLVGAFSTQAQAARRWLKQHGRQLFYEEQE